MYDEVAVRSLHSTQIYTYIYIYVYIYIDIYTQCRISHYVLVNIYIYIYIQYIYIYVCAVVYDIYPYMSCIKCHGCQVSLPDSASVPGHPQQYRHCGRGQTLVTRRKAWRCTVLQLYVYSTRLNIYDNHIQIIYI